MERLVKTYESKYMDVCVFEGDYGFCIEPGYFKIYDTFEEANNVAKDYERRNVYVDINENIKFEIK